MKSKLNVNPGYVTRPQDKKSKVNKLNASYQKMESKNYKQGGAKSFPDKNKDGKITQADILMARGVFKKGGSVKPSAGLTEKKKSAVAKKASVGKDIGKKGKNFAKVAAAAGGGEKGKRIAAAAMWKNIKRG